MFAATRAHELLVPEVEQANAYGYQHPPSDLGHYSTKVRREPASSVLGAKGDVPHGLKLHREHDDPRAPAVNKSRSQTQRNRSADARGLPLRAGWGSEAVRKAANYVRTDGQSLGGSSVIV